MKHQPTFGEPSIQDPTQCQGLTFAPAVADDVVGIPLKRHTTKNPPQPNIERIVQEQVGQQWADYTTLRRSLFPRHQLTVLQHRRRFQPTFDVEQYPGAFRVLAYCPEKKLMIDTVEEAFDVDVHDPVVTPAPLACRPDRINRRAPWPISVGVLMKHWLQERFQISANNLLCDAVCNRWNPQRSRSTIRLRNFYSAHRGRHVAARRHSVPELIEVPSKLGLEALNRLPIYSSCSLVGLHTLEGLPYFSLRYVKRLCLVHAAPPVTG